ncbi:MAG: hypothetical protein WBQ17_08695 [Rhizomicrobium sp.]
MQDQGVKKDTLIALVTLLVVGIRYPLKILPLLFWEMTWTTVWLLTVASPAWQSGTLNADAAETAFDVSFVWIVVPLYPEITSSEISWWRSRALVMRNVTIS